MAGEDDKIASPTLAELYYRQADIGKAMKVLKEVLARNPENQEVRARLREMELEFLKVMDVGNKNQIIRKLNKVLVLVRKERLG